MEITRKCFIDEARKYVGVKFAHQGRNPKIGIDCGGLILIVARSLNLSELEYLGYADFPDNGKFEQLLTEHADYLNYESKYPHRFGGTEFQPGDLLSFDYLNGEGTRHIAVVTNWDGKRYWVIDAQPQFGISEHPLAHPFSAAAIKAWSVRGLIG